MTVSESKLAESRRPVGSRIAVVVNGNAKSVTEEIISSLDQIMLGGDLFVSKRIEETDEIAETLVSRGYGTVLTGGGDGTFMVMVSAVVRAARRLDAPLPRFGFLKLGTGNALAHVVGATGGEKAEALAVDIGRLREDAGSRLIRLIEVDDLLSPFCGFGTDAGVLKDYNATRQMLARTPLRRYQAGGFAYALSVVSRTMPKMLVTSAVRCKVINRGSEAYRIAGDGSVMGRPYAKGEVVYDGPARVAGVATIPFFGFGFRAFPFAEERSDRMHVRVSTMSPVGFARNIRSVWSGQYDDPNVMFDFLMDDVEFEMSKPTPFQIAGDVGGDRRHVRAKMMEEPIRLVDFYAPPSAD